MRVALSCPSHVYQYYGGGEVLLDKTYAYLRQCGIEAFLFDPWKDKIDRFDILHYFGVGYFNYEFLHTVKDRNVKLVLTPIFPVLQGAQALKRSIYYNFCFGLPFLKTPPELMRRNARLADSVLAGSHVEKEQLSSVLSLNAKKIKVVHYGADKRFLNAQPELFARKFNTSDYILCVGRFDSKQKNQLALIRALKDFNGKCVFVGNPDKGMEEYYHLCKKEASKNTLFINPLPQDSEMLASCYAGARLFVVPSKFEYPGLAGMEAALAGCGRFAMTDRGCTKEYYGNFADYFNPFSVKEIKRVVMNAYNSEDRSKVIREHFKMNYLWENYSQAVVNAYKEVFSKK